MASLEEMKEVLRTTLENNGSLRQIRARIRAEIFRALDDQPATPELSNTNMFINELIREYLEFNGYKFTASVLVQETGQPEHKPFDREFLSSQLKLPQTSQEQNDIPLLYHIMTLLQHGRRQFEAQVPSTEREEKSPPKAATPRPEAKYSQQATDDPQPMFFNAS